MARLRLGLWDHPFLSQAMMLLSLAEIKLNHAEKDARPLLKADFWGELELKTWGYCCITPIQ
jgi:hypothetical protein